MTHGEPEQKTRELLRLVADAGIEHVVVGGVAAIAWGGSEFTQDLDIVMPFDVERIARLMAALAPHRPRHWTRRPKDVVTAAQLRAIRSRLPPR
jgi:hypothetical protein